MTPDDLRIAVRQRSILECLDLACMFCVRRCTGIAVALLVGALPMALINVVLIGPDGADRLLPSWFFWLALQTPWAMAPLTLFLGLAMFTDRLGVADWRGIAAGMAGAVGPLLIYQTLLRGLSILLVLPFPFFLVALAFVDPVILLERGPIRGIWRRSTAIFARSRGRILAALALEMVIVPLGWVLAVFAIDQLASLWAGRPVMAVLDTDRPDWALGRALFTWRGQLAWWGVMTLVTVFRFVTYIDTRIRDEGWDIELKLRNPATYVGLERWRGAAAVIVIVALLIAPAAAVGAEEEGEAAFPLVRRRERRLPSGHRQFDGNGDAAVGVDRAGVGVGFLPPRVHGARNGRERGDDRPSPRRGRGGRLGRPPPWIRPGGERGDRRPRRGGGVQ